MEVCIRDRQKYFVGQQRYLGSVNGHVEEMYGGHLVMKAFNGEKKSVEMFDEVNEKLYTSAWKSQFLSGLMQPIMGFVGNLGYVLVCIIGASTVSYTHLVEADADFILQFYLVQNHL